MNREELIKFFENKRKDFPILNQDINGHKLVYTDNGASTQKPQIVIDTIVDLYTNYYSNVHRGIHSLSEMSTERYEEVRLKVAKFINADKNEIIFTKGATEGLNKIAFGLMHLLKEGDEILLTEHEHHANLVPWQEVAKRTKAVLKFIPLTSDFRLDLEETEKLITEKTKIISLAHVSNVLGIINPIKQISTWAKRNKSILVVDGAQSVPHMKTDVKDLGCDFLTFSSHKMCGPTGVGIIYGKYQTLEKLQPTEFGGDMIYEVEYLSSTYNNIPYRFEAGTPNIEGVIAFGAALDYLSQIGMEKIEEYEHILTEHFLKQINEMDNLTLFGPTKSKDRAGVFSFNIKGIHPHDLSVILDNVGIAIRGGHHCAMPLVGKFGTCATSRVSLYFYNTLEEIDYIVKALKNSREEFNKGNFL